MTAYGDDLAYVHDTGYGDFARKAAPGVLALLRDAGVTGGLVADLGCGSGIWARRLLDAGYEVLGVDVSAAMLDLARLRVPQATFVEASFLDVDLPPCAAVTALGECFNYAFDPRVDRAALRRYFERVAAALRPGGVLVFDVIEPGLRLGRTFGAGEDWATLVELSADPPLLVRDITAFRRVGDLYRRSEERHPLLPLDRADLIADLEHAGLRPQLLDGYGDMAMLPGRVAVLAAPYR